MKSHITAIALFSFSAAAVALYPAIQNDSRTLPTEIVPLVMQINQQHQARIEVVFVLDTTGSMSGLIQAAKDNIWSIASSMASAKNKPEIKMGLVAYRDRGDAYVTRTLDLSDDLDSMYAALMDFKAEGGGDGPESVNQALHDAVSKMSWSRSDDVYKVVFLVGDAPPHMDYQDDVKYPQTIADAARKGIVVNTIQCGQDGATTHRWQQMAQLSQGRYFQVGQSGNAVAVSSPFDAKLASLSRQLDDTRLYYGDAEEMESKKSKIAATDKLHENSSVMARARRAVFNRSDSGSSNQWGSNELVEDVSSGRVKLDDVETDDLPDALKAMSRPEQLAVLKDHAKKREALQQEIESLATQRKQYIKTELAKRPAAKMSLDEKIYATVREQAEEKGLLYESESAVY